MSVRRRFFCLFVLIVGVAIALPAIAQESLAPSELTLVRAAADAQAAIVRTATAQDVLVATGSQVPGTPWRLVRVMPNGHVQLLRAGALHGSDLLVELSAGESTAKYTVKTERAAQPASQAVAVHTLSGQKQPKSD